MTVGVSNFSRCDTFLVYWHPPERGGSRNPGKSVWGGRTVLSAVEMEALQFSRRGEGGGGGDVASDGGGATIPAPRLYTHCGNGDRNVMCGKVHLLR